jgi:tRNA (cytidine32/uridine32-2'-O)-methyltransferase
MQLLQEKEAIEWPTSVCKGSISSEIHQLANANEINASILFGREDRGLTNEELQMANKHLIIPAAS